MRSAKQPPDGMRSIWLFGLTILPYGVGHAHRFRHTLATELLEQGWTYEDVAEVLGNSAAIVRKHYAKWSRGRQNRLTEMMKSVFLVQNWYTPEKQPVKYVS